jgi:pimeloyl-ACP methyl ester carboxylesterase
VAHFAAMASKRYALLGFGAALGAVGGLAVLNRSLVLDDLPPTLPGATHDWTWRGWRVRYTTLGDGPPLVLVHGVHAAASSVEMDAIFEPLAHGQMVYALDLLGFGKSQRPAIAYTADLYVDLLADFLTEEVGRPAVVLGSSLGAAYAVAVAARRPDLVERLVLISPTGRTQMGRVGSAFGALLGLPLVGQSTFNTLVSRPSIRRYLSRVYADSFRVDDALVSQHWAISHQPNARFAPAAFVGGRLDLPLESSEGRVHAPILVLRGDHPGLGAQASDGVLRAFGVQVETRVIAGTGQLPHQEVPDEVVQAIEAWLASMEG